MRTVKIYTRQFKGESPDYDIVFDCNGQFEDFGMLHGVSSVIVSKKDGTILNLPLSQVKFGYDDEQEKTN